MQRIDVQRSENKLSRPQIITVPTLTGGPAFPVFPGFPVVPGIPGEPGGPWQEDRGVSVRDSAHHFRLIGVT